MCAQRAVRDVRHGGIRYEAPATFAPPPLRTPSFLSVSGACASLSRQMSLAGLGVARRAVSGLSAILNERSGPKVATDIHVTCVFPRSDPGLVGIYDFRVPASLD